MRLVIIKTQGNEYKVELIEILKMVTITFCDHSTFTDLCRGGHIPNTGIIKAVKYYECCRCLLER